MKKKFQPNTPRPFSTIGTTIYFSADGIIYLKIF